jgi:hypothetical protein
MPYAPIDREKTTNARIYDSTHGKLMKILAKRLRVWEKDPEKPKPWLADIIAELVNGLEAVKSTKETK